ncbi:MAG: glycosyltransferase family 2 protein, partial [Myxococcales bacterium]|nr:glycosyltransferase family 2 protein [Myxococcales bacterium]
MKISIIVPAYNEALRIEPTLRSIALALATTREFEILVVDDGSEDGTQDVVDRLRHQIPQLSCIASERNRGKGHAVRLGMMAARGRVRVMCDADGSIAPHQIPKIVNPILAGKADVVIASRYAAQARCIQGPPAWRQRWSRITNRVVQATVLPGIQDTQCGFKAFSSRAAQAVFAEAQVDGWAFDLEVLALVSRAGFRLLEVGIEWHHDQRS